jgi:hypothetical protein
LRGRAAEAPAGVVYICILGGLQTCRRRSFSSERDYGRAKGQRTRADEVDDERKYRAWYAILRTGHDREGQAVVVAGDERYGGQGQFLTLNTFN